MTHMSEPRSEPRPKIQEMKKTAPTTQAENRPDELMTAPDERADASRARQAAERPIIDSLRSVIQGEPVPHDSEAVQGASTFVENRIVSRDKEVFVTRGGTVLYMDSQKAADPEFVAQYDIVSSLDVRNPEQRKQIEQALLHHKLIGV